MGYFQWPSQISCTQKKHITQAYTWYAHSRTVRYIIVHDVDNTTHRTSVGPRKCIARHIRVHFCIRIIQRVIINHTWTHRYGLEQLNVNANLWSRARVLHECQGTTMSRRYRLPVYVRSIVDVVLYSGPSYYALMGRGKIYISGPFKKKNTFSLIHL